MNLVLTQEQAATVLAAVKNQRGVLELVRQDMITNLCPQTSIKTVTREALRLAEVERMIKEAL